MDKSGVFNLKFMRFACEGGQKASSDSVPTKHIGLWCQKSSLNGQNAQRGIFLDKEMILKNNRREFHELTYKNQDNYKGVSKFKRILNYFVAHEHREFLLDKLEECLGFNLQASGFYVDLRDLVKMQAAGNLIGSHSVSHPVMSRLGYHEQRNEISKSFAFLNKKIRGDVRAYCHPYGGFYSFDKSTVDLLESFGASFSFNVEPRDIVDEDLISSIQSPPRYDCNEFPFGKAS